jgi:two-component system sensor histidine kinase/response regulator
MELKPTVLIVDDNKNNLFLLKEYLKSSDFNILTAGSGKAGLELINSENPDLILLDILMPGMNGFELLKIIRERGIDIPVIFVSALDTIENIEKGIDAGAVDYITKPVIRKTFIARVRCHIERLKLRNSFFDLLELQEKIRNEQNEFIGIAAHDLKNPVFSIQMLAKILNDEETLTEEEIKEFSGDILESSEKMLNVINNVLDISKIENGKKEFTYEIADFSELLKSVISSYELKAATKDIELQSDLSEGLTVNVDRNALIQVFDNLVSNALKYSPIGGNVRISTRIDSGNALISVRDYGEGLTDDDKKKLFGKFAKLSAKPTNGESSSGLGLSIAKSYVDAMKGRIWCESEHGKGAEFFVSIPLVTQ